MTTEEKQEIIDAVVNEITTSSVSIEEVETVTDVTGVATLPCSKSDGTIVQVAVSTLAAPAKAAAETANASAAACDSATQAATAATAQMQEDYQQVAEAASAQTASCKEATDAAEKAADNIGNKKILVITEDQYAQLLNGETITIDNKEYTMDTNTLYFCTEE